jgi:hypothetical protein
MPKIRNNFGSFEFRVGSPRWSLRLSVLAAQLQRDAELLRTLQPLLRTPCLTVRPPLRFKA